MLGVASLGQGGGQALLDEARNSTRVAFPGDWGCKRRSASAAGLYVPDRFPDFAIFS